MADTSISLNECQNTDRELWREREGDYYADSIHVTEHGGIGINCGGKVIVKPLRKWFEAATRQHAAPKKNVSETRINGIMCNDRKWHLRCLTEDEYKAAKAAMGGCANLVSATGDAGKNQETGEHQAQHSGGNPDPSTLTLIDKSYLEQVQAHLDEGGNFDKANQVIQELINHINILEKDNFTLAANQCHDGYGDEHGNHRCKYQDDIKLALRHENDRKAYENLLRGGEK